MTTNHSFFSHSPDIDRSTTLFSTPLEVGLRTLVLLDALAPNGADMDRLIAYDYLLVHSDDAGGPESIHPALPHRGGELLVKREVLHNGLSLLLSRELISISLNDTGVQYASSVYTTKFLTCLAGAYIARLKDTARWVVEHFGAMSDGDLRAYINTNISHWGGEFINESVVRGISL